MSIKSYILSRLKKKVPRGKKKKDMAYFLGLFKTWSFRVSFIVIIFFVLVSSIRGLFQKSPVMSPLTIPGSLEGRGYTSKNITTLLVNEMNNILEETETMLEGQDFVFSTLPQLNNITLPGSLISIGQLISQVKSILNISSNEFSGGFYELGNGELEFRLFFSGEEYVRYVENPESRGNFNLFMKECAEKILQRYHPQRLGLYYKKFSKKEKSEELTKYMLTHKPESDDSWAYTLWAWNLEAEEKFNEAGRIFERATANDPGLAYLWSYWGNTLSEMGDEVGAMEKHQKSMELDPKSWQVYHRTWISYIKLARYNESQKQDAKKARELYSKSLEMLEIGDKLSPENYSLMMAWAFVYFQLGDYDNSLLYYEKALDIRPNELEAIGSAGYLYSYNENYEKAISMLEYFVKFDPQEVDAQKELLKALYKTGNYDDVIFKAGEILDIIKDKRKVTGLTAYELSILDEREWEALYHLSLALKEQEKFDEALVKAEQALQMNVDQYKKKEIGKIITELETYSNE